jgi:LytS/YehU family sensor histidine kinase
VLPPWWRQVWFYVLMALGLFVMALGLSAIRVAFLRRRERTRSAFTDLRLQALQAQMNPHFVSNTLVAVQSLITEGKGVEAKEYLAKFAELSRRYLEASYQKMVPLEQELAMLQTYLDLEKLRFGDKFDFEIDAPLHVTTNLGEFPARLLQPLAENAIHHGLVYLKRRGMLRVEVRVIGDQMIVAVDDDGIGRLASSRLREKRKLVQVSRGSALIDEILKAINSEGHLRFQLETIDKYDLNGQASGTRVEVRLLRRK